MIYQKAARKPDPWPEGHPAKDVEKQLESYMAERLHSLAEVVDHRRVQLAAASGDPGIVDDAIHVDDVLEHLSELADHIGRGVSAGRVNAHEGIEAKAATWVRDRLSAMAEAITESARAAMKVAIRHGVEVGRHVARLANDALAVVGLTEGLAGSVARRRESLEAQGVSPARANRLADKHASNLAKRRAHVIARTEAATAVNRGRGGAWGELGEVGVLDGSTQMKRWDATLDARTCPVCEEMDNKTIPVGQAWVLPDGMVIDSPPAHPSCRCAEVLV